MVRGVLPSIVAAGIVLAGIVLAGKAKRGRVDRRRAAADKLGDEASGAGADAETMARKARCKIEPRQGLDLRNHRNGIGGCVDHAGPALNNAHLPERGKGRAKGGNGFCKGPVVGARVEYPVVLIFER